MESSYVLFGGRKSSTVLEMYGYGKILWFINLKLHSNINSHKSAKNKQIDLQTQILLNNYLIVIKFISLN